MINILCPPQQLKLGRKGENEFRTIEFDVAPWLADYPNGSISVVYMRPDGVVYPPEVSTANGVTSWVITSIDTAAAGAGYAEIRLIDGDVVGKSARINTMVYLAVNGTEIAPPAPDWTVVAAQIMAMIGNLDDLTTEAKSNLVAAINEAAQSGGGGGTGDHRDLTHRDAADQHPMSAITGLVTALSAKGTYSKPSGGIPYADLAAAVKASLDKADSALQTAPVASVNGKTGAVNLVPADLGIGSVFTLKGSKPTYADLPATGNTIGDVWYVVADSVGYIWLNDGTVDRWEQLGMEIDLSAYRTAAAQDVIDAGKLSTSGGTVTGDIRMGATVMTRGKITMLADPTTNYDAVNKGYADGHYAEKDDLDELQDKALTATVTIAVADWASGTTAVKNVTGVTATNIVICDSSDPDVQCTAQGAGTLTFTATATPSAEVTVKVVILP